MIQKEIKKSRFNRKETNSDKSSNENRKSENSLDSSVILDKKTAELIEKIIKKPLTEYCSTEQQNKFTPKPTIGKDKKLKLNMVLKIKPPLGPFELKL